MRPAISIVTRKKHQVPLCSGIQDMDHKGHATNPMCRFSLKILDYKTSQNWFLLWRIKIYGSLLLFADMTMMVDRNRNDDGDARNLKWGIGSLFDPCVNTMGRRPYCPSCMEVSCCTFGFSTIIRRDLRTLSLPHDSQCDNLYACVIWVHSGKATHS